MMLTGISMMVVNIPMQVHLQKSGDPSYLGRVFGLLETISTAIAPLRYDCVWIIIRYVAN